MAEYSTVVEPQSTAKVAYTTTDHLGSPRIITDALGQVKSRRDFMPFGEELTINVGNRSTSLNYGSTDNVRQKFTGYQKDAETSLDFAEARMYENRFGRFTAVDPLLTSGKSANPQTFNRFVYAGSNPILRKDQDGKDWVIELVKQKVEVSKNGKISTKEIEIQKPLYVPPGEGQGLEKAQGVWGITFGDNAGKFRALHPTENRTSELFDNRADAEAVYNAWSRGTSENPKLEVVVFESTILNGQGSGGPVGHVAWGVNNRTYSWEGDGYEANRNNSFSNYLQENFKFRNGTVTELNFGSPERNRSAANEIELGPRNAFQFRLSSNGYNLIRNNCGETICRVSEQLNLPRNNLIAPFQHQNYVNSALRPFIVNQQRFGPPPPPAPPPIDPCKRDARMC